MLLLDEEPTFSATFEALYYSELKSLRFLVGGEDGRKELLRVTLRFNRLFGRLGAFKYQVLCEGRIVAKARTLDEAKRDLHDVVELKRRTLKAEGVSSVPLADPEWRLEILNSDRLRPGDHIKVKRKKLGVEYEHHGVYVGGGRVCHYWSRTYNKRDSRVMLTTVEEFSMGSPVAIVEYDVEILPSMDAVSRCLDAAISVLLRPVGGKFGRTSYSATTYNCEHFSRDMKTGRAYCEQLPFSGKEYADG